MQVKLIPSPDSELPEIVIEDNMFSIGRNHKPFLSYPKDIVAQLSRNHARIFIERGSVFIVDTNSSNGTVVNGTKLEQDPVSLNQNDSIDLGNNLAFKVAIVDHSDDQTVLAPNTGKFTLTLTPLDNQLTAVVIKHFPFLISKINPLFSQFKDLLADDIAYISRKHAYFFIKDNQLYIEDLASTNGTFVNDVRLGENAIAINDGDNIGFGGKRFVYSTKLDSVQQQTEIVGNNKAAETAIQNSDNLSKTTFVTSADSFIDIFCAQEEESLVDAEQLSAAEAGDADAKKTFFDRVFRKERLFLRQIKEALADDRKINRKVPIGIAITVILIAATYFYWNSSLEQKIYQLVDQKKYAQAVVSANDFLKNNPDHEEIRGLASDALLKSSVPYWATAIEQQDFSTADQLLSQMRQNSSANQDFQPYNEMLDWVGNLEEYIHNRGGQDAPLTIYQDEPKINEILDWWHVDKDGHRRTLHFIDSTVPEFNPLYRKLSNHLTGLMDQKSTYIPEIQKLKSSIQEKLDGGRVAELGLVFDRFQNRYPNINGIDQLRKDWRLLSRFDDLVKSKEVGGIIAFLQTEQIQTAPFQQYLEKQWTNLPESNELVTRYTSASRQWRNGDTEKAIALLSQSAGQAGDEFLTPELQRKQNIISKFNALNASKGSDAYRSNLMEFFKLLDASEDIYFVQLVSDEVETYKSEIANDADLQFKLAENFWDDYYSAGRIGAQLRLERRILKAFRTQANRLSKAYQHAQNGVSLYESIKLDLSPQWQDLYTKINKEFDYQWYSLDVVRSERSTVEAKLKLFVKPE